MYIENAQRVGGPVRTRKRRASAPPADEAPADTTKDDLGAIRQWARENGYGVSERGRIAQSIKDAFHSAQN